MSMPDPMGATGTTATGTTATRTPEMRGRASDSFPARVRDWRETKPSFKTSELWLMLVGIAALIVTYNVSDDPSLDLWRTCLLCVALGAAYIVSRGIAKAGSHDDHVRDVSQDRDTSSRY